MEEETREANRGLWKDPIPIPPWVVRNAQRVHAPEVLDFDCPGPSSHPVHQRATPALNQFDIIGNRRSHIYRRVDCPGYDLVSEDQRIAFVSVEAAEQAGYRADWHCP